MKYEFIYIGILGFVSHFLYDLLGKSKIIGLFVPINESVWEHLKLLFFPVLLFVIIELIFYKKSFDVDFIAKKMFAVMIGMFSILIIFYTYSGIIGKSIVIVDIILFYISILVYMKAFEILSNIELNNFYKFLGTTLFFIVPIIFFITTFYPPNISIFQSKEN